jgi:hypothetical protein
VKGEVLNFLCRRDEDCERLGTKRHKQGGGLSRVFVKRKGKDVEKVQEAIKQL